VIRLINLRRLFLYLRGRVKHLAVVTVIGGLAGLALGLVLSSRAPGGQSMLLSGGQYAVVGLLLALALALCVLLFMYAFSKTVYAKDDFTTFSDVPESIIDGEEQSDEYVADACYSVLPDGVKVIGVSSTAGDEVSSRYAGILCDALSRGGHDADLWTATEDGLKGLVEFARGHDIVVVPVPDITVDPLVFRIGQGLQGMVMAEKIGRSDLLVFDRAEATLRAQEITLLRVVLR
jgi:hypothetical protein